MILRSLTAAQAFQFFRRFVPLKTRPTLRGSFIIIIINPIPEGPPARKCAVSYAGGS